LGIFIMHGTVANVKFRRGGMYIYIQGACHHSPPGDTDV
jgi:hypothetical protein